MREIEFRGKRKNDGKWIFGDLSYGGPKNNPKKYAYINIWEDGLKVGYVVKEETLGQYTGLKNRNGTKIYEGDIVKWADFTMEIFWGEDIGIGYGFCWRPYGSNTDYHESMTGFIDEYEVIGTIYDKSELLGE